VLENTVPSRRSSLPQHIHSAMCCSGIS